MATYRKHTNLLKLKVVQEYIAGASVATLVRKYHIHENLVYKWRKVFDADPTGAFRSTAISEAQSDAERIAALEQENAQLAQVLGKAMLEQDFLKKALQHAERTLNAPLPGTSVQGKDGTP